VTGPEGNYQYTQDLMKLGTANHCQGHCDARISRLATPLNLSAWKKKLGRHPDADFTAYILNGIEFGFRIGVDEAAFFQSAKRNMQSAGKIHKS